MAIVTSHLLNGVDGSHAGRIPAVLKNIDDGNVLASSSTDEGGRLSLEISSDFLRSQCKCEIVFNTIDYWRDQGVEDPSVIGEVVLRFTINDPSGKYHMPIILSPFSYSTWKSG